MRQFARGVCARADSQGARVRRSSTDLARFAAKNPKGVRRATRFAGALAAAFLIVGTVAYAQESGTSAARDATTERVFSLPGSAFPGDCSPVLFFADADTYLSDGEARIVASDGTIVAKAAAFSLGTARSSREIMIAAYPPRAGFAVFIEKKPTLVALLALPSWAKPGDYDLRASCRASRFPSGPAREIAGERSFTVEKKKFPSETVRLNAANAAIKTDDSDERKAQIARLNDMLLNYDDAAPRFRGPFAQPVATKRRTSAYAHRRVYRYPNRSSTTEVHAGIDFGVPVGTPVRAAGDGLVVMAERRISTGWTVALEHEPGVYSLYYHLSEILVTAGDRVETGQVMAKSGNTGFSTGPHLHWEFRVNGVAVSPDWFTQNEIW